MKQAYNMDETGFTLIELLVVLLTLSIILISVPAVFKGGTQVWEKGDRHAEVLQNALIGMEQMTRDLRQAESITSISIPGEIQFENKDGDASIYKYTDDYLRYEPIYDPDATTLTRLAGPVNSLIFTGYDQNDAQTTVPEDINSVKIEMHTYDSDNKIKDIPLSSRVYLRERDLEEFLALQFAIFGKWGVKLNNNLGIGIKRKSNVGSNGDVIIENWATVNGDVVYNGTLDNTGTVDGEIKTGYVLLPCPKDFSISVDAPDMELSFGETVMDLLLDAVPGNVYGDITIGNNEKLILYGGSGVASNYYFRNITAGTDFGLEINLCNGGDINIFVEGQVKIGNMMAGSITDICESTATANQVYFEVHHKQTKFSNPNDDAWRMGRNTLWLGTVYAPYGNIFIADGTIEGALYSGAYITVFGGTDPHGNPGGEQTTVNFAPSNYLQDADWSCSP